LLLVADGEGTNLNTPYTGEQNAGSSASQWATGTRETHDALYRFAWRHETDSWRHRHNPGRP
jgi:hypothetical protein